MASRPLLVGLSLAVQPLLLPPLAGVSGWLVGVEPLALVASS